MKVFAISSSVAILIISCVSCVRAAPSVHDNRVETEFGSDGGSSFSRAAKFLAACFESDDMSTCLAVKGITALNRAARSSNIELVQGVTFKRDPSKPVQRGAKSLSENDVVSQLPESGDERTGKLVDLAMQSAADFLSSHNLEVKIPTEATQEVARAIDEGRGKLKKMLGPVALAIGAKVFAIVPLVIFGLALLTFKAVIVSKIALLLALFLGGSRLFGGAGLGSKFGGSATGYNANAGWSAGNTAAWSASPSSAYPYARSLNSGDAQEMAYAGQVAQ